MLYEIEGWRLMSKRHRVFISYHHANDEDYRKIFELRLETRSA
jgi:hypothetical protein